MENNTIKTAVIGASGYTGLELVRLLLAHPNTELTTITSRQFAGKKLSQCFPHFSTNLKFEKLSTVKIAKNNHVVFVCLPHHESMDIAKKIREHGAKVIDLSADFRFESWRTYEKVYGKHKQRKLLKESAYGLCEIFSKEIQNSYLVGAPGCYVTSILLALAPLVQNQMIGLDPIICDSKSGTSGAGRSANISMINSEIHSNFKAYGLTNHRHRPEIEEKLNLLSGSDIKISFTPHLLPISRGILSTIYVRPLRKWNEEKVLRVMNKFYKSSPFVKVLPKGKSPQLKDVIGTNNCLISAHYDDHSEQLILISVLDNLLKGASGQAVQCLNLMCGFDETAGLDHISVYP